MSVIVSRDILDRIPQIKVCATEECEGYTELDPIVYHFKNTGAPYMLRRCRKCRQSYLVLLPE